MELVLRFEPDEFPRAVYHLIYRANIGAERGGLMSYATNVFDLDRRAATYVDEILKARSLLIFRWSSRRSLSSLSI